MYKRQLKDSPILIMKVNNLKDLSIIYWSGEDTNKEMILETHKDGEIGRDLVFHSSFTLSAEQDKVWVCDQAETHDVTMYKFSNCGWAKEKTYSKNSYPLLMLELSSDEIFVIGTFMTGFQVRI